MNSTSKYFDLSKTFRFESAHRLAKGYNGKCANIHGHSWNGKLTVRCAELDEQDMGIDYGILKEAVLKTIEDIFDHKIILFKEDPLVEVLRKFGTEVVTMEQNPTSEAIAQYIFDYASEKLNREYPPEIQGVLGDFLFEVIEVTVDETCTSSCKVTRQCYH